jgi:hypothetical protein
MGLIKRVVELFFGKSMAKLLDMTGVCRCTRCCSFKDGWTPCENKVEPGNQICAWCSGSGDLTYPHCHGLGNAVLKAGWKLNGPVRQQP